MFTLIAIFDKAFDVVISKCFFHGYSFITVCMILNHARTGIDIYVALKYANNIVMVSKHICKRDRFLFYK
ncbi:CMP-sialic acid transporter 4 [Platanthera zijinensis]|uniref:CMP-sialic acid transporter 4 n=1 Tax=Platanthera zijinensis TaxID=2320716 RepID=A0AAP0FTX5_9ASPA